MRASSSIALIVVGAVLCAASGCRTREGTLVAVTVTAGSGATWSGVESLSIRASVTPAGGTRVDRTFALAVPNQSIPPDVIFGIEVPANRSGSIEVEVAALGAGGAVLAKQSRNGELSPGTTVRLTIALNGELPDLPAPDLLAQDLAGRDLVGQDLAVGDLSVDDLSGADLVVVVGEDQGGGADLSADLVVVDLTSSDQAKPMCTASTECTAAMPICGAAGACRPCNDNTDDAACVARGAKRCITAGANDGQCGQCNPTSPNTQSADCPSGTPVCTAMGSCALCTAHDQCTSTICDLASGACVASGSVAYVENNLAICNNTLHASTPAVPYCEISSALSAGKAFIRVAGSATAYQRLNFTDQLSPSPLTILGPGKDAAVSARVFGKLFNGITINYTSAATANATLIVDGLVIGGTDSTNRGDQGIRCTNASSFQVGLVVRNTLVEHNGQWGIFGSNCNIDVSTSTLSTNEGPALEVNGGTNAIRRTQVINNPGGGIVKQGAGKLDVANVVVAGNGLTSFAALSGIRATAGTITIANVTVARNLSNSSLFSGVNGSGSSCTMLNTVVTEEAGEDNMVGCSAGFSAWNGAPASNDNFELADCNQETLFTNWAGYDFHLSVGAALCSLLNIGGVSFGGVTAPNQDIEGTTRPLQGANDIGAYERP